MRVVALLIACIAYTATAGEVYKLIVNVKNKSEEYKLKSLGFSECKSIDHNTLLCSESEDKGHILRLRDFLTGQNISAKVIADNKPTETAKKRESDKHLQVAKDESDKNKHIVVSSTEQKRQTKYKKDSLDEQVDLMYSYLNAENLEKAAEIAKKLLDTRYSNEAKFVMGLVKLKTENFDEACKIFSSIKNIKAEAKKLEIDSCWVYYMQEGYNNLEKGNLPLSQRYFEKSLSYKDNIESRVGLFYVFLKLEKLDSAGKIIEHLYSKNPENPKVKRAYIDFLIKAKKFQELSKFENELTDSERQLLESQNLYTQLNEVDRLIKDKEFEVAENILKSLYIKYPSNLYVLLNFARLYTEIGDFSSAESFYKNVLLYDKNNKDALKGLKFAYIKLGRYEDALKVIDRLNSIGIKDKDENMIKELYYIQKAQNALKENDIDQAERFAREALNINENNSTAYLILSNVYKNKSDRKNYFKYISKAFELEPNNFGIKLAYMYALTDFDMYEQVKIILRTINRENLSQEELREMEQFYRVLYNKLSSYYLKNKDYKKAKKVATEGLEIFTLDDGLLEVLGWSCYNLKDYECSKKAFENTISLKPDNDMAKLGLAYTYLNLGNRSKLNEILKSIENSSDTEVLKGIATIYVSLGKYTEAEKIISKIEKLKYGEKYKSNSQREINKEENLKQNTEDREIPFILYKQEYPSTTTDLKVDKMDNQEKKISKNESTLSLKESEDESLRDLKERVNYKKQDYIGFVEVGLKFRDKSGESGKSKLTDASPYILVNYFINENINLYAGSYFTNLTSGTLSDYANFGTPQNLSIKRTVPSGYSGIEPFIGANIENENFLISTLISTTPFVDNKIKSSLTYLLEGKLKTDDSKIGIGLYRRPIRDSILSYVGTLDPYTTDTSWGRVLENGVNLSFEKFDDKSIIYSQMSIGKIKGENTETNNHLNLIFMPKFHIGNYISDKDYAGLFIMYDRFSKNQDCYYYGCGGYFSPKNLLIAAPMIEGYKFSDKFGLHYKLLLGLLNMNNKDKNSSDISFDGYVGGIYKMSNNIFLNLATEYRKASEYNEVFTSLYLQYFFGGRFNITDRDLLKQEKDIYKR